ncbi:peptide ABC transporter substrate-binding protein [Allohahella sp. A8]|uniref:peptide ABC transporter substrate-binding protein n=1 Tax=Allohahella sp. A8 TaxID=3141461 RepID=UPI003A806E54
MTRLLALVLLCLQGHVAVAGGRITLALSTEPPSLNSMAAQDEYASFLLRHLKEGLTSYGVDGELIPGVAERWELEPTRAVFHLRRNARWHDGKIVTAHDFVYAWRRIVDPAIPSPYAYLLYPILNAEAIVNGEQKAETLGVKALDDFTIEVTLERPCAYFLALTAYMTYLPVRADYVERFGDAYAADADKQAYNGPFTLASWVHGARLQLLRNPTYWNSQVVELDAIDIDHITSDPLAVMNLFADGGIALANIGVDNLDLALQRGMPLKQFKVGSLFFLRFNFSPDRVTSDPDLRKAISLVYSPRTLVDKIIAIPGFETAGSIFPEFVSSLGIRIQERYPQPPVSMDIEKARAHLEIFMTRHGLEEPPAIHLLTSDSPGAGKQAEFLQNRLQLALGLDVRIDKQIFKQRIAREAQGLFDITMSGWGPDYDDAMTFADLFASWNPNNRGGYASAEYDALVAKAQMTLDPDERAALFNEMQILLREETAMLPLYENALVYLQDPALTGVVRLRFGGDPLLTYARKLSGDELASDGLTSAQQGRAAP